MVETTIRHRVMLEPRGFIRVIGFVLAIVCFATTGGYNGAGRGSVTCGKEVNYYSIPLSYPFNLQSQPVQVPTCNSNGTSTAGTTTVTRQGDFSPTAQWFVFVAVMAFLICLGSIIFYVAFETGIRATNEFAVTVTDLVVTGIWAFLWLTAASAWAWGLGQVKQYSSKGAVNKLVMTNPDTNCAASTATCRPLDDANYGPLNASVAFAFLSFIVWAGNVWFVYKETPYHNDQANGPPREATEGP